MKLTFEAANVRAVDHALAKRGVRVCAFNPPDEFDVLDPPDFAITQEELSADYEVAVTELDAIRADQENPEQKLAKFLRDNPDVMQMIES